MIKQIINLHS